MVVRSVARLRGFASPQSGCVFLGPLCIGVGFMDLQIQNAKSTNLGNGEMACTLSNDKEIFPHEEERQEVKGLWPRINFPKRVQITSF